MKPVGVETLDFIELMRRGILHTNDPTAAVAAVHDLSSHQFDGCSEGSVRS